jgi:arylsulfatase A-like enzyme
MESFFLWVHYFDPHFPYDPPGRYESMYDPEYAGRANGSMDYLEEIWDKRIFPSANDRKHIISLYDGEISYMDEHLGRLFTMMEKSGLMDHSIVVVVADHGESLGEHGYDFDHGLYVYDASIRVPLLIYAPSMAKGRVIPYQVETLDIFPTVLDLLDIPVPGPVEGQSLRPLLEGSADWTERTVFSEASKPWNVEGESDEVFRNDWKAKCARTREWKYIYTPFAKTRELYHLAQDPDEITNLLGREPDVARDLEGVLQAWTERPRRRQSTTNLADQDAETLEKLRSLGYLQ